jgi:DNA-binding LacI/PurR family transcriptional regulator
MTRATADLLLRRIAGVSKPTHIICPTTLVERDSA